MKFFRLPAHSCAPPSRPPQGGWIEIVLPSILLIMITSRPPQGGWIEIFPAASALLRPSVPPPTGRVD